MDYYIGSAFKNAMLDRVNHILKLKCLATQLSIHYSSHRAECIWMTLAITRASYRLSIVWGVVWCLYNKNYWWPQAAKPYQRALKPCTFRWNMDFRENNYVVTVPMTLVLRVHEVWRVDFLGQKIFTLQVFYQFSYHIPLDTDQRNSYFM